MPFGVGLKVNNIECIRNIDGCILLTAKKMDNGIFHHF